METKKQLLIQVLTKLIPYRDLAEGILALVESSYVDEKILDGIIYLLKQNIQKNKNNTQKKQFQKGLEKIQKIKAMEDKEKMSQESLDELLADI